MGEETSFCRACGVDKTPRTGSYGDCNCLVLGNFCQNYQTVNCFSGSLLILCTCITSCVTCITSCITCITLWKMPAWIQAPISGISRFTHCPWSPVRRPWGFLWHWESKRPEQEVSTDERRWKKSLRLAPGLATGKAEWTGLTPDEAHSGKGGGKRARDNVDVSNVMLRLSGKGGPRSQRSS